MKLKLLLVFTICSMVSMAQSKTAAKKTVLNYSTTADYSFSNETLNENNSNDDSVKVYPTVTQDVVYYALADEKSEFTITVYNMYGKQQKVEIYNGTIDLSQLKGNMYLINFTCKEYSVTKNVIKK